MYAKGYALDWGKVKVYLHAEASDDARIGAAVDAILAHIDRSANWTGTGWTTGPERRYIIAIAFGQEAFGTDLEKLRQKDIAPPEYLQKLDFILDGPEVFEVSEPYTVSDWLCLYDSGLNSRMGVMPLE